jgi:hypothetical protein
MWLSLLKREMLQEFSLNKFLSQCPFISRAISVLLSKAIEEITDLWLNSFHSTVYSSLQIL